MNKKFSSSQPLQIQLAVDGSEHSMAATQLVNDLPLPQNSRVTILGVVPPGQSLYESKLRAALMQAEKLLGRKAVETESVLLYGHAAKQLIEYGSEHRPDLMVIGAKGLYATLKILLGGVAHQVVEHARWPVLVVRTPYRGLRRVLLATDGSQNCRLAAQYLAQFPLPEHTEIQVLHVQALIEEPKVFAQGMGPFAYLAPVHANSGRSTIRISQSGAQQTKRASCLSRIKTNFGNCWSQAKRVYYGWRPGIPNSGAF